MNLILVLILILLIVVQIKWSPNIEILGDSIVLFYDSQKNKNTRKHIIIYKFK